MCYFCERSGLISAFQGLGAWKDAATGGFADCRPWSIVGVADKTFLVVWGDGGVKSIEKQWFFPRSAL
jgi:hypothetical protein